MLERDRSWLRSRGLRHILLRESFSAGQMILVFFISNADSGLDAAARLFFAHLMEAEPSVAGAGVAISADTAKSGRSPGATRSQRSAAAGSAFPKAAVVGATAIDDGSPGDAFPKAASGEIRTVTGVLTLLERIGGQTFQISPESFFQVNTEGARRLYAVAADFLELTGKETLLDLYCGTGAVGLSLSPLAGRVVGIESVAEAVNDAKRNARRGGVRNAEFLTGRAEEWLPKLFESGLSPDAAKETAKGAVAGAAIDTVVLDPPRKGCAPSVLSSLIQAAPPRILYISCEPSTLARDLKILRQGGYAVRKIQPLDMFPQTFHVETVVLLARP
jgi:23S rRNA (uracil1939-C5)-methyltransferase